MTVQVKKICLTQKLLAELKSTTQQFRRTADEKFKIEVESSFVYSLRRKKSTDSQNPLLIWRDHGSNFPTLQLLASLFLGMSAGSVAVASSLLLDCYATAADQAYRQQHCTS